MTEKNVVGMYNIQDEYPVFQHEQPDEKKKVDPVSYETTPLNRVASIRGATSGMDPIKQWRMFSERLRERREAQEEVMDQPERPQEQAPEREQEAEAPQQPSFQQSYERSELSLSQEAREQIENEDWYAWYESARRKSEGETQNKVRELHDAAERRQESLKAEGFEQPVKNLMTRRVVCALDTTSVERVADICVNRGFSGIPIVDNQKNLQGIVTLSDLLRELLSKDVVTRFIDDLSPVLEQRLISVLEEPVSAYMQSDVLTIEPHTSVAEACQIMDEYRVRRLIVARNKQVRGIFSARDAVRLIAAA